MLMFARLNPQSLNVELVAWTVDRQSEVDPVVLLGYPPNGPQPLSSRSRTDSSCI